MDVATISTFRSNQVNTTNQLKDNCKNDQIIKFRKININNQFNKKYKQIEFDKVHCIQSNKNDFKKSKNTPLKLILKEKETLLDSIEKKTIITYRKKSILCEMKLSNVNNRPLSVILNSNNRKRIDHNSNTGMSKKSISMLNVTSKNSNSNIDSNSNLQYTTEDKYSCNSSNINNNHNILAKLNRNKIKEKTEIDRKFDPPSLNNMTLFNTSLIDRFKKNIILNKYTWNRKRNLINGKPKTFKETRDALKFQKDIFNEMEKKYYKSDFKITTKDVLEEKLKSQNMSILNQRIEHEKLHEDLRKEFLTDLFISNKLSTKSISLNEKILIDEIKNKFKDKYKSLNYYYLEKMNTNEFDPMIKNIEKSIKENREMIKNLSLIQRRNEKSYNYNK